MEDLSSNGSAIDQRIIVRDNRPELGTAEEVAVPDQTEFLSFNPHDSRENAFRRQHQVVQRIGKGSCATGYLCVDKSTEKRCVVKRFERTHRVLGNLYMEIAVMMSMSHPNVLCLKESFQEEDGVYLILGFASEGELFHPIVARGKLTEDEARKVFVQLFQGVKYLVRPFCSSPRFKPLSSSTHSMNVISCTEISSRRTYCWPTKSSSSSLQTSGWLGSLMMTCSLRNGRYRLT